MAVAVEVLHGSTFGRTLSSWTLRIRRARAIGCPHLLTGETPTETWNRTWTESESPSRTENPRPNEQILNPMPTLGE